MERIFYHPEMPGLKFRKNLARWCILIISHAILRLSAENCVINDWLKKDMMY